MVTKNALLVLGALCIPAFLSADAYSDQFTRIINSIANAYDAPVGSMDPDNMTAAALQAVNFIMVENDISKNSPLGRKNKYITMNATTLQKIALNLLKLIQRSEKIGTNKTMRDKILREFWHMETMLKQLEGKIDEIGKKQLLPLTKVQKDLINLLALLAAKNLALAQRMISNVGNL